LDVRKNQLGGGLTATIAGLSSLEFIGISYNNFSGAISERFADLTNLRDFLIAHNNFIFSDFESIHNSLNNKLANYTYAPQGKSDTEEIKTVTLGNAITLTTDLTSESNTYLWYKDGERIQNTNNTLVIEEATLEDAGVYYFSAINSEISGLELIRHEITLNVIASCNAVSTAERNALVAFFNATGGPSWTNQTEDNQVWDISNPDSKICDWYGVTVNAQGKVIALNLSGNNLEGSIPEAIGSLIDLEVINLNSNALTGAIPQVVAQLPVLTNLNIANNVFIFNDFEANFPEYNSLPNFSYSPQAAVDENEVRAVAFDGSIQLTTTTLISDNNNYQWLRNGIDIPNATSKIYTINNANAENHAGMYSFRATNNIINGLTLTRGVIELEVEASKPLDEQAGVTVAEKDALIDLYNTTGGVNWTNNANWLTDLPVEDWYGVSVEDGHVVGLELTNNNLSGVISTKLGDLLDLENLRLNRNGLTGTIPSTLGNLYKLKYLSISSNDLTGEIPESLGNLSALESFYISFNNLSGVIPSSFSNLQNLKKIYFGFNDLSGEIPSFIGDISTLTEIRLESNQFSGNIPSSLANLSNLSYLFIGSNTLIGEIPSEFGNLNNLKIFRAESNNLSGNIPSSLINLSSITELDVRNNELSGKIPSGLASHNTLKRFIFNNNRFVFNDFQSEHQTYVSNFDNYTYFPQKKVNNFETKSVKFGASITITVDPLLSEDNVYQWFKRSNGNVEAIDGAINNELTITNATEQDSGEYYFTATNSIIDNLVLERNKIELRVLEPDACDVAQEERDALIAFYQSTDGANWTNTLEGTQPWLINNPESRVCDWYGITVDESFKVVEINLPDNKLRGDIEDSFGQLLNLKVLNLESNQIAGEYPTIINTLSSLEQLNLSDNILVGEISAGIDALINLQDLDLGGNRFLGSIPLTVGNLSPLMHLDLSNNKLENQIPETLWGLVELKTIKLQENRLSGGISDGIGNLSNLEVFWVNNNRFSGNIPQTISIENTPNLYSIHLNHNFFSGNLPQLIPNLALPNTSVQINNNAFIFSNFENEFPSYQRELENFGYYPQSLVDQTETRYIELGESTVLTSEQLVSNNNRYQWYKKAPGGSFEPIPNATNKSYTLTITEVTEFGNQYRFIATNTVINVLELTRRTITILEYKDTDGDGDPDHTDPDDDNDDCEDTEEIANGSDPLDPEDNKCPPSSEGGGGDVDPTDPTTPGEVGPGPNNPEDYVLCESLDIVEVGYLVVPNGGSTALWYETEDATTPLFPEEILFESQTLWAAIDGATERIPVPLLINEGRPGIFERTEPDGTTTDESYQVFRTSANATVGDLKITPSEGITWYASATTPTPLSLDTPLVNDTSYYASLNGHPCRFEVEVFIGIPDIFANSIQYLCAASSPTLEDVETVKTYTGGSVRWYAALEGGTELPASTLLVDGTTYYATEYFEGDESEIRMPVEVFLDEIELPEYLFQDQMIFHKKSNIPTIADLSARDESIIWYQLPEGGTAYAPSAPLVSGDTYYAAQLDPVQTCESNERLAVTVITVEEPDPILVGCEKFKPNPGNRYIMSGWVREQGVEEVSRVTRNFITDVSRSDRLIELLNHLVTDFVLNAEPRKAARFLEEKYIPDLENKVYDVTDGPTDNLAVYNFKYVTESVAEHYYKRTIGFQFSLSPEARGEDYDFKYVTPIYENGNNPQHYPLFDNPTLELEFTGLVANGNTLGVVSQFSIDSSNANNEQVLINGNTSQNTPFNNIELNHTFITYQSDPDYQVESYLNSLIEVVYENEAGEPLELDPSVKAMFKPKGAVIDGWQRISADFFVPSEAAFMSIVLKNTTGEDINSYFDDIRMHPFNSNMKAFVYDPITQRLQAELDENNYATYYEYDKEGGLVRVKKETERGIYTIQETRSNSSK
jgi:Leucine-rich repeat (LRR) protein